MTSAQLFSVPIAEAGAEGLYNILSHVIRCVDCMAVAIDDTISEGEYLGIIDYYTSLSDAGGDKRLVLIPECGYIPPGEYQVKVCRNRNLSEKVGLARKLSESNVWLLAQLPFGNVDFMLLPVGMPEQELVAVITDWAFVVGFSSFFVEQLVRRKRYIDFAAALFVESKKTHEDCLVFWGGNENVVKVLSDACKQAGVNARNTLDF